MQEYIDFFTNNKLMCLIWAGIGIMLIMSFVTSASAKYTTVDTNQLTALINREDGLVVDIRSPDDFNRGHISGAVNLLPSEIKDAKTQAIESHKNKPIIVVCKIGQTATSNANILAQAGFENVSVLKGGMSTWNEKNLPTVAAESSKKLKKKDKKDQANA